MGDTIHIKSEDGGMTLSSYDLTFTIDNEKTFQEVFGHKEKIGKDDEVYIYHLLIAILIFFFFLKI